MLYLGQTLRQILGQKKCILDCTPVDGVHCLSGPLPLLEEEGGPQQLHVAGGEEALGGEGALVRGLLRGLAVVLDGAGHGAGRELRQRPQVHAVCLFLLVGLGGRHFPAMGWSKRWLTRLCDLNLMSRS